MERPKLLINCAKSAARRYRRERDLPGAIAGLMARPETEILPTLISTEQKWEAERQARSAAYKPSKHVQVLAALLAESDRARMTSQTKASGSDDLRSAM